MVYCASKLFYKAIDHTFYAFTGVTLEKLVNHELNFSRVLATSRVGYHAGKPIESAYSGEMLKKQRCQPLEI